MQVDHPTKIPANLGCDSDNYGFMNDVVNNINGDLEAALETKFGAAVVFGVWFNIFLAIGYVVCRGEGTAKLTGELATQAFNVNEFEHPSSVVIDPRDKNDHNRLRFPGHFAGLSLGEKMLPEEE